MKDIRQKLLATFQIEHRDHVEQIRSLLAMIENTGAQPARPELEEVFRRAHSLKGAARAVDLHPIEDLAHRLETLFSRAVQGEVSLTSGVTVVVQQVLDASEDCIAALSGDRPAAGVSEALHAIENLLGIEEKAPPPAAAEVKVSPPAFQPLETVRITMQNFDGLFRSTGELVTESQRQDQVKEKLDRLIRDATHIGKEAERLRRGAVGASSRQDASHELSRIVFSLDSMERQVRSIARQASTVRRLHQRSSWALRHLGKQLQRDVWQARTVPAESLLEGYRKMVRDQARDEGKEVTFRATSAGVHADRRVLETLKDPLMHLLRNSVSHGIEAPADRVKKGKSASGLVTLSLDANGQHLTVVIQDDGRGVDLARVAEVAVRDGMLSESNAAHSSAQGLMQMLFRPGFSTATSVTSFSGRGMGLSVVYEAVRRLQGDLDIHPVTSGGTRFSLSVPLSVATRRLVIVKCGHHRFAIPIFGIERLLRIKQTGIETVEGKPVIVLNKEPVNLASIHGLLGVGQLPAGDGSERLQVVVLRSGRQRVAVVVDAIERETEAVIQDLGRAGGCQGKLSSGVVLDDGAIAFVLNPMELIQNATQARWNLESRSISKSVERRSEPAPHSILVVDDSMTTRTLEKSILEARGYHVRVAIDGLEALARLREERFDLVIADVEMPRLNGFGLVEAMKKNRDLDKIPVIIVSSLERREDQERGLALGADAYIVKQKFDQDELLAAIRQIL